VICCAQGEKALRGAQVFFAFQMVRRIASPPRAAGAPNDECGAEGIRHFRGGSRHLPKMTCLQRFEIGLRGHAMGFSTGLIFTRGRRGIAPKRVLHRSKSA
jgi:hypothetical protein